MRRPQIARRSAVALCLLGLAYACGGSTEPKGNDPGNSDAGERGPQAGLLSVWTDYPGSISVSIDGGAPSLTTASFSTPPSCGQSGTVTVTATPGLHTISGIANGQSWNESALVAGGQCTLYKLTAPTPSTGQLSIWTNYSTQIAVRVDGGSVGTLTSYFSNGTPACGQAGTITVSVATGIHSVSGTSGQATWNGNATVVAGQCTLFELRSP